MLVHQVLTLVLLAGAPQTPELTESARLVGEFVQAGDRIGSSVGFDGTTLAVGAPLVDTGFQDAGVVFVYERDPMGTWRQVQRITAQDASSFDLFGSTVVVEGSRMAIGALGDDVSSGSVYLFERTSEGLDPWVFEQKLTASDAADLWLFGFELEMAGDLLLVGAERADVGTTLSAGQVYVFERQGGGSWLEVDRIAASDPRSGGQFGRAIALDGDRLAISAFGDADDNQTAIGAVYVLDRAAEGAGWAETRKILAPPNHSGGSFGTGIALAGDELVIGEWGDDEDGQNSGSVWIHGRNAGGPDQWDLVQQLRASDASSLDNFGFGVALEGNRLIVSATGADGTSAGTGVIYDFGRSAIDGLWSERLRYVVSDGADDDILGLAIGLADSVTVGAAPRADLAGDSSGGAFVFEPVVFADGFESGDTLAWSSTTSRGALLRSRVSTH